MSGSSSFGARLSTLRRQRDLSQRKLAGLSGVAPSTISELEHGVKAPAAGTAQALDKALDARGELAAMVEAVTRPARPRPAAPVHPFGSRLRQLRDERGWGLRQLAAMVPCTHTHIAQMERGERAPSSTMASRLDDILGAEGELAALAERRPTDEADIGEEGDVYRRSVLTMLAGVPMLAAEAMHLGPLPGAEALRHNLTSLLGGPVADVAEWEETAWSYGCTYATTPPEELLSELRTDIALAGAQLASIASGPDRHSMQRVIALMAAFMAHTVANLGNSRAGLRWWRTARRFADASNDSDTRTWVRGREIVRGMYERRSLPTLLALADEASAISQQPGMGTGSVLAGRAQVLAMLGRAAEARQALAVVRDASDHLPATVADDAASMYGWPEHRLRYTESYVFTFLGDRERAEAAQDQAFQLFPDHMFREHAQVELHRAIGLVRSGDIPGGVEHAQQVVGRLPAGHRIATILELARSVEAAVPPTERRRPQVAALRELLALPAGPTG